jgi:alkylation response protein AidB-like acyl-CoA dehydrogenase
MNDHGLNEDQIMIQQMAYDFATAEFAPKAAEWDETKHFPMDVYKKAAE